MAHQMPKPQQQEHMDNYEGRPDKGRVLQEQLCPGQGNAGTF